jgi:hypothetical protein
MTTNHTDLLTRAAPDAEPGCDRCGKPSGGLNMGQAIDAGWWFTPPTAAPDAPDAYCPDCVKAALTEKAMPGEYRRARYVNGEPTNLPAAAYDALEWCRWITRRPELAGAVERPLRECIAALERELRPCLPAVYETTEQGDA